MKRNQSYYILIRQHFLYLLYMNLLKDYYKEILIAIFVITVVFMSISMKETFTSAYYYVKNKPNKQVMGGIFNIDQMIKETPNHLGWKKFWRENYSNFNVPLDDSFNNSYYEIYAKNTPLLYDGVRNLDCEPSMNQ